MADRVKSFLVGDGSCGVFSTGLQYGAQEAYRCDGRRNGNDQAISRVRGLYFFRICRCIFPQGVILSNTVS